MNLFNQANCFYASPQSCPETEDIVPETPIVPSIELPPEQPPDQYCPVSNPPVMASESSEHSPKTKKVRSSKLSTKSGLIKKAKRCTLLKEGLDESYFLETPIFQAENTNSWAMVAGPNKPPKDK